MIDEVHMLTNHAFNSMLKTLEEPPEHVKFILATTDPQKIPVTVLSRCLQFNLKQMPPGHIVGHLANILGQENVPFEQPALRLLAQGAHGSMRDALSLTDQAIAYAAGEVTLESVQGMLGALDQSYLVRLLDALARQDGADLLAVADEMASRSLSYNGALQDLGTLLHRIALAQTVPSAVPSDLPEYADIVRLAGEFDAEEVQLYYQIAVHGRNELGLAPDEYAGFSMTLLRMLAFRPGVGGAEGLPAAPAAAVARGPGAARAAAAAAGLQGGQPARAAAAAGHASMPPAAAGGMAAQTMQAAQRAPQAGAPAQQPGGATAQYASQPGAAMQQGGPVAQQAPQPGAAAAQSPSHPGAAMAQHQQPSATVAQPQPDAAMAQSPAQPGAAMAQYQQPGASMAQSQPQQTAAPAPYPPQAGAAQGAPAAAAPLSPARAAIQAALEAARAASGIKSPSRPAPQAQAGQPASGAAGMAPQSAQPQSSGPSGQAMMQARPAPAAQSMRQPPGQPARPAPAAQAMQQPAQARGPAPWEDAPQQQGATPPWEDAPWDDGRPAMGDTAVLEAPPRAQVQARQQAPEDDLPPWVTEFSDDSAVAAPQPEAQPAPAQAAQRAPAKPPYAYVIKPVPELDWDGNWPTLAAHLPLRGVAQQLATQAELVECVPDGAASAQFRIRVPIETWRTPANVEKLAAALTERFNRPVRVETELGPVWYTTSTEAQAYREALQRAAEDTVANDPFIQSMIRDFGAFVVPGSIVPPPAPAAH
jgi:DNA polymerase-3 subunit gamma/tau